MILRWIKGWLSGPRELGARGEMVAAKFLKRKGYKIVERGHRNRLGEIDLIAVDSTPSRRCVVFVEVKTRTSDQAGRPVEAVDALKQQQLTRVSQVYRKRHDLLECPARFDVVAVTWPEGQRQPQIEHFPNAFDAFGQGQLFS